MTQPSTRARALAAELSANCLAIAPDYPSPDDKPRLRALAGVAAGLCDALSDHPTLAKIASACGECLARIERGTVNPAYAVPVLVSSSDALMQCIARWPAQCGAHGALFELENLFIDPEPDVPADSLVRKPKN